MLQVVSESDIRRCTNEEAKPRREVDTRRCANKDAGTPKVSGEDWGGSTSIGEGNECQRGRWASKGGWFVRSHIG